MDRISELPDNAIDNIIERLSLRDAVRTSILSSIWQYKWTTLSTLSMDTRFVDDLYQYEILPGILKTVLSQHNGPLHKFELFIPRLGAQANEEITVAIRVALMKGVQELTVSTPVALHVLPSILFSCGEQLTKLKLVNCVFNPPFGFRGFSNLKTFHLWLSRSDSDSDSESLSSFVSSCPKLQEIELTGWCSSNSLNFRTPSLEYCHVTGTFRSIIFQETPNLVSLVIFHNTPRIEEIIPSDDYMLQLLSNMAKLKYLRLGGHIFRLSGNDFAPRKLSTIFQNLKTIEVCSVDLGCLRQFNCILGLIMSSPNLQHLEINGDPFEANFGDPYVESGDYKDFFFEHLRSVRITHISGSKGEWKLIEILLGYSPVLQKFSTEVLLFPDYKTRFSKKLRSFRRASPIAKVSCISQDM